MVIPIRRVGSNEMAHSLQSDDWIWVMPSRVRRGDVIVMTDPLDDGRRVLRRVIAEPGQMISYDDGIIRIDGKRIRQSQQGTHNDREVFEEVIWSRPPAQATRWSITRQIPPAKWKTSEAIEVPQGHWYVLADARDDALDSRWWGTIDQSEVHGVVRARWSSADPLRTRLQLLLPAQ